MYGKQKIVVKLMKKIIFFIHLYTMCLVCFPLTAQNLASVEAPYGISFTYGLDYHPVWYTQLKSTVGFGWTNSTTIGRGGSLQYIFNTEQRYNYNIIKRQSKGKNTLHKSANFFSVKPTYIFTQIKYYDTGYADSRVIGNSKYNEHHYYCSINWGIRRAIGKCLYFDKSIGLGPSYNTYDERWRTVIDLNISIGFKLF